MELGTTRLGSLINGSIARSLSFKNRICNWAGPDGVQNSVGVNFLDIGHLISLITPSTI